jgi:hypothetical protein
MSEQSMNLYQKISQVMRDVEYLSKDDKVEFGNTKYKAISEEKVTSTIRASLIKNGLVIIPIEQEAGRVGNISTVNTKYKIIDIDKGVGKAMTYAYKYLLLRTFAIPTGEDPDKISSAELDEKQRKEEEKRMKEAEADAALLTQLHEKWTELAGSLVGFEEWHTKQKASGQSNAKLNSYLANKLTEKKKESA